LIGDGEKLQALCKADAYKGDSSFAEAHKIIRRGDIVGFRGIPGRSQTN
jgi:lysyl-tRNA synthetase class 2